MKLAQLTGFEGFSSVGSTSNPAGRIADLISQIIAVITIFAGLTFIFWFVISAITWIAGGHDSGQIEKAKSQMSNALIGLLLTVITLPIIYIIGKLIGLNILNLETLVPFLTPS